MSIVEQWQNLLTAAVLGAERTPAPPITGELADVLASESDPATAMLRQTAALSLVLAASQLPRSDVPAPPVVEEGERLCPSEAAAVLASLEEPELVVEWCELASTAGAVAPPEQLPALLELGLPSLHVRGHVARVLGTRGRWLAEQNDRWRSAYASIEPATTVPASADLREAFETESDLLKRTTLLQSLRRQDAAAAREVVAATWKSESADVRLALLRELGEGLSPEDQPFLEEAAKDRSKHVKALAGELLVHVDPARGQRLEALLGDCVIVTREKDGLALQIEPPTPKQLREAGVEPGPVPQGSQLGAKAAALAEVVGFVPIAWWSELGELGEPVEVLAAIDKSAWPSAIYWGLVRAAAVRRDGRWAAALLSHFLTDSPTVADNLRLHAIKQLPSVLSPEQARWLTGRAVGDISDISLALLRCLPGQWDAAVTTRATQTLLEALAAGRSREQWLTRQAADEWRLRLDPETALPLIAPMLHQTSNAVLDLLDTTLRLRHRIHQSMSLPTRSDKQ